MLVGRAMKITATSIGGVAVVEMEPFLDNRGAFTRLFCTTEFSGLLETRQIAQINRSHTNSAGAVRGLHYQRSPFAEMKFVTCLNGRVWDVAVDLRAGSR